MVKLSATELAITELAMTEDAGDILCVLRGGEFRGGAFHDEDVRGGASNR
jgi:hypothetical protein